MTITYRCNFWVSLLRQCVAKDLAALGIEEDEGRERCVSLIL